MKDTMRETLKKMVQNLGEVELDAFLNCACVYADSEEAKQIKK